MILNVALGKESYDVIIEQGALAKIGALLPLDRRVLVVTDSGVPCEYAQTVCAACRDAHLVTVPMGEGSKSFAYLELLCAEMLKNDFTRTDAVVAVGGGVVGDLAGFAAASYMRGIDFYNVPTTLLSQLDSSIGGKTAINHAGVKNCIGAFHQPKRVVIDPNVLTTLPRRQLANGLAEGIKMAATCDAALFARMEREDPYAMITDVIVGGLSVKKAVVEQDARESSLRRVLNFGHTLGHGIESAGEFSALYHGECVALGMLPLCAPDVRLRLKALLERVGLPTHTTLDFDLVFDEVKHDKKADGHGIHYVYVPRIGEFELRRSSFAEFRALAKEAWFS